MANERQEMLEKSATLYFGPWYRKSPIFEATRRAGCTAYDIYNHMYLPGYYDDPEVEYWALNNDVTMWDVGVERTVEVSGPDADRLIDMITCRDLTKCAGGPGQVHARHGARRQHRQRPGPAARREEQVVDAARRLRRGPLRARGAGQLGARRRGDPSRRASRCRCRVRRPSRPCRSSWATRSYDLKYYWCGYYDIEGIPVAISRTGWTAIPGFEVNLLDYSQGDALWDAIMKAGEEFNIRPIAPCEARRIEAGIFNYGSDIRLGDTPFHVMGLERLVEEQPQDYIGKAALEELRTQGRRPQARGHRSSTATSCAPRCREYWPVHKDGKEVGHMTDAVWSPGAQAEHRLRLGADRARGAGHHARRRVRERRASPARPRRSRSSTPRRKCPRARSPDLPARGSAPTGALRGARRASSAQLRHISARSSANPVRSV